MWNNITALSLHCFNNENIPFFKNLPDHFSNNLDIWKKWAYEKNDPENFPIPEFDERIKGEQEIGQFLRFCLIRSIRNDRTITATSEFIEKTLGEERYTKPVSDTIESIFNSSTN